MSTPFSVMTWNVENLFPPGSLISPTSRTPVTEAHFNAKLTFLSTFILSLASKPDVIALQEIGGQTNLSIEGLQARLAGEYPHHAVSQFPDSRPIRVAFLARTPLQNVTDIVDFPAGPLASIPDLDGIPRTKMGRGALKVEVEPTPGVRIRLINAHLKSKLLTFPRPNGGSPFVARNEDERALGAGLAVMRRGAEAVTLRTFVNREHTAAPTVHTIVCGDFNDEPQAATTQLLLGGTPDRDVMSVDGSDPVRLYNLVDALPLRGAATHTFLAPMERFTRIHEGNGELIDHLMVSKGLLVRGNEFVVQEVRSFVDLIQGQSVAADANARAASTPPDHAPVLARFSLA